MLLKIQALLTFGEAIWKCNKAKAVAFSAVLWCIDTWTDSDPQREQQVMSRKDFFPDIHHQGDLQYGYLPCGERTVGMML